MEGRLAVTSGLAATERLLEVLPGLAIDGGDVCRVAGVDLEQARLHGRLPVASETAIWDEAARRVPSIPLGVVAAERCFESGVHESTLYEYIGRFAPTLRDAALAMRARQRLETDAFVTSFVEEAGRCIVRTERVYPGVNVSCDRIEFGMVRMFKEARRLTAWLPLPVAVSLRRRSVAHRGTYDRVFGVPVRFGEDCDTMTFPPDCLDTPLLQSNPPLHAEILRIADGKLAAMAPAELWPGLLAAIERTLPDGENSLHGVARRMGVPIASLNRLIRSRGLSWIEVVDSVRRPLAERLLRDPSLAISMVGYRVGFANPASFTKAFRRWTHMTPEEYRRSS
jgi:AraC-like DNA-binding protein